MTERSPSTSNKGQGPTPPKRATFGKGSRASLAAEEFEAAQEESTGAWCIVATLGGGVNGRRAGAFDVGATVYCLPPMRGGAFESVEVIGPDRKKGKLTASVVAAADLENWKAMNVTDPVVLEKIAPPWDSSHVSRNVAEGIVAWKSAGGAWPVNELRIWNRSRAERVVVEGSLLTRIRGKFMGLLGRE